MLGELGAELQLSHPGIVGGLVKVHYNIVDLHETTDDAWVMGYES